MFLECKECDIFGLVIIVYDMSKAYNPLDKRTGLPERIYHVLKTSGCTTKATKYVHRDGQISFEL